jgi:hypothetical protein
VAGGRTLDCAYLIEKEEFHVNDCLEWTVIIEEPQVYRGSLVDPNSLVKVGMGVGWVAGIANEAQAKIQYVKPHDWKGNVEKDLMTKRIEALLTPEELHRANLPTAKGKRGDVLDAIGIGLWHFKRLNQLVIRRGK